MQKSECRYGMQVLHTSWSAAHHNITFVLLCPLLLSTFTMYRIAPCKQSVAVLTFLVVRHSDLVLP